jgi:uncharacterized protein YeaO (DUF488 family)
MYVSSAVARRPLDPGLAFSLALHAGHPAVANLPQRLLTACLFEPQDVGTIPVLVTRLQPKRRTGQRYHAWWPQLAPSLALLHAPYEQVRGPEEFASAYRAELDALPDHVWLGAAVQLTAWLRQAPSVTLLSFERTSDPSARRRMLTQRQILRGWLLGQLLPSTGERGR